MTENLTFYLAEAEVVLKDLVMDQSDDPRSEVEELRTLWCKLSDEEQDSVDTGIRIGVIEGYLP